MVWRWDQGRLQYFQFDNLSSIASVLVQFDGADMGMCEPLFRAKLQNETGMPFAPAHYTVRRNYQRVFQCAFLATFVGNKLIVTDYCKELANGKGQFQSVDDFLFWYLKHFRFPFPAFNEFSPSGTVVYPFCAIIKRLLAMRVDGKDAKLSLDDIFRYIAGNNCTGFEDLAYYKALLPVEYHYDEKEQRQGREMLIFVSQHSILKMYGGFLYLDVIDDDTVQTLLDIYIVPDARTIEADEHAEFLKMTSLAEGVSVPMFDIMTTDIIDMEFIEGKRKRMEHFRVERSPLLRKYYIESHPHPVCEACGMEMQIRYPWTDYLLDIHHLLPLATAIAITGNGTSLSDIIGICPSCHRAVHVYYKQWLKANDKDDFASKGEATDVFCLAKKEIA
jgi:hypothetical protein